MTIELPDPDMAIISADGAIFRVPRALVANWNLPAGSHSISSVFLPFPAHIVAVAIRLHTTNLPVSVDAKTTRSLIALEAYGVPVLSALIDCALPEGVGYTLRAVRDAMMDKSAPQRRRRGPTLLPPAAPAWCRAVLEDRAPHALRALDA